MKRLVKICVFYIIQRHSLGFVAFASTAEASSANESFKICFSKQKLRIENHFANLAHLNLHSGEKDEFVARI